MILASLTAISFLLFLVSYLTDKRRILNGFLLTISMLLLMMSITVVVLKVEYLEPLKWILVLFAILFIFLIPFIIVFIAIYLIRNGRELIRKEGKKPTNLLSLTLGVAIILFIVSYAIFSQYLFPSIISIILVIAIFYGFWFFCYLVSTYLYFLHQPFRNKDFIIVLGSGIIGEKVPPLLASRLDKGISFYYKQMKRKGKRAKFVVTGGQGPNESIPEGEAMARYLRNAGIPSDDILVEDKAVDTDQNMRFSKEIMEREKRDYKAIFVTNRFHLFRAGLYAKRAGLSIDGIGSKTASYFVPNAFIREFIAILFMYKSVHLLLFIPLALLAAAFLLYQ
ncbi:YdcF family protein [Priestia endophytica]|uniref:YdcF family protein n=1 Tax=Priestia endophytica TaxID=135735 RepID=UPI002280F895|nr:ElyC/SanA/YdcF family protein [Priestia endophytica]MCY8231243.1 YdcF family protein [Priestia endophytica]